MAQAELHIMSGYLDDFDNLETDMLNPILQLTGSNFEVILDTLTKSVATNPGLGKNAMLVLQNISMWCFQADWERWSDLFNKITELPEITVSDLRIISKLQNMAWQEAKSDDNKEKEASQTLIYDNNKAIGLITTCATLENVVKTVSAKETDSMWDVVMATCHALSKYTPRQEEMDQFIPNLERLCQEKQMQRVPRQFIDMLIPVLKHSAEDNAENLISLLTSIRQSKVLSSSHRENVFIKQYAKIEVSSNEYKFIYRFKHPSTGRCTQPGECGFILKYHKDTRNYTVELVTNSEYYIDTGVHYHDVISARDMCVYWVVTLTLQDGTKLDTVMWGWWKKWLPADTKKELKGCYVAYNVSDYMVAK